jgi:hypothetical protein
MSWLENLSIISFRRRGHPVAVYSYAPMLDLPLGAEWRDAATILPLDQLVFYKGRGTPAVFSDRFRLELLRRGLGIYADLDIYCIKPFRRPRRVLMAFENARSINNAVLFIDADEPLLGDLLGVFETKHRALWLPFLTPLRRVEVAVRRALGEPLAIENMQFGASGPMPLTYYVRQRGLAQEVLPPETFYPVPYEAIPGLMQPGSSVSTHLRPDTLGIHLWRSQLTDRGRAGMPLPPPGSAMAELCAREGLDPGSA